MDPFVIIEYRGNKYKSRVIDGGGVAPKWNDKFDIEIVSLEDEMKVECFDEDLFANDLIGDTSFKVSMLCSEQHTRKWLPLKFNGTKSGLVLMETIYTPPLESWPEQMMAKFAPMPVH